ncbi:MAG: phage holin family protein [Eubacteriales bacterium]|nr:phage holin family protein [Eubacteriales bacterium]
MHFLISWLITTLLFYGFSELGVLIKVSSFSAALQLSFFFALFYLILRLLAFSLKLTGCLTLGIGYLVGLVIQMIAYPLALLHASEHSQGVSSVSFLQAVILSILVIALRDAILQRLDEKTKKKRIF